MINPTQNNQTAQAAKPDLSAGPTNPALIQSAANLCPPDETESGNIALTVAELKPTPNANASNKRTPLTFTSSERQQVRYCEYSRCGKRLVIKRPNNFKPKRFCNNQCKRRYHYLKFGK